jgi:hypothetical protein
MFMASKKILLVEGNDDEHVFKAIFGQHHLAYLDEIKEHGGYTNLIEALPLRLIESDVLALGVVCDADTEPANRWTSIRNRLEMAGYVNVPQNPDPRGLVIVPPENSVLPRFGIWIMPDNQVPGILEQFLEFLVPVGDKLFAYTELCIRNIPEGSRLFRDVDLPKAKIHTWLAWQKEPGKPLGQSITKRVLRADSDSCRKVVDWLRRLYFSA